MSLRILWFAPLPAAVIATARNDASSIAVEFNRTTSSDQQFEHLRDGIIDAAVTAIDNVIAWNERAPREDFRVIAQVERTTPLSLVASAGHADFRSLRGARLLVDAPGNGFVVALRAMLADAGYFDGDYELVPAGGVTERFDLLVNGVGDATLLGSPFAEMAIGKGFNMLASINDRWPQFPGQGLVVSMRRVENLRTSLQRWLEEMSAARAWAARAPIEAAALLERQGMHPGANALPNIPTSWRPALAGIELLLAHRRTVGLTGGELNYDDLVNSSFLGD